MKYWKRLSCLVLAVLCMTLTACVVDPDNLPPPEPVRPAVVMPNANGEITWGGQTFSMDTESLMLNIQVRSNEILDLSPLSYCTDLRQLSLHVTVIPHIYEDVMGDPKIAEFTPVDLTPLAGLTGLERLDLNVNRVADLYPLAALPNLSMLVLWFEGDIDLAPLASCRSLVDLSLGGRAAVDLAPLRHCAMLSQLRVDIYDSEWKTPDLSALSGTPALQTLSTGGSVGLRDLVDVPLTTLIDLNDSSDILKNLPMLETLTNVEFSDEHINDITPLLLSGSVTNIVLEVGAQDIERGTVVEDANDPVLDQLITSIPVAQLRQFLTGNTSITLSVNPHRAAGVMD
ncbi:MAG: hypothetical protein IKM11_05450 [Oscillospiraceae bacterium]|nr:hypothetical protein [Oscillospiraceae bacterium]